MNGMMLCTVPKIKLTTDHSSVDVVEIIITDCAPCTVDTDLQTTFMYSLASDEFQPCNDYYLQMYST